MWNPAFKTGLCLTVREWGVQEISTENTKTKRRPTLSVLALISFIASFAIARTFTTLSPNTILLTGNLHIHHFWYGILMLAIGGWLGISYSDARTDRLAAVIFGAGGGLIGDEAGLLLTFENYWTGLTYTILTGFLAIAFILILIAKYSRTILNEFTSFARSNASLYFGVFLATISIAFLMDTDNPIIIAASSASAATGCLIILTYLIQRITRKKRSGKKEP